MWFFDISEYEFRALNASFQAPSGLEEPCFLSRLPSGKIGISFTPREIGEHLVSVKHMGKHISASPFNIHMFESDIGDAKKVRVSGTGLNEGRTHHDNTFAVDTSNAGHGVLSVSIKGPNNAPIQCIDKEDGTYQISYKPTEPGYYVIDLKYAYHHIEYSPFTVKVEGKGSNRKIEEMRCERFAAPVNEIGSKCQLTFKMSGITSFDLGAYVKSPTNVIGDAEIEVVEDDLYAVHFVPTELGVYTVSVHYMEMHISGSPFQYTVGPFRDIDFGSHLVKAGGFGLERGVVGQACEFNVWTREAGGGWLDILVEGPSQADIEFNDHKNGACDVAYKVTEPGEYRIGLIFNNHHIPDSPFSLYISPDDEDAHQLEVSQFPQDHIDTDGIYQFLVHTNGTKGELDAQIVAPSGISDDCFIQITDDEMCTVHFEAQENGINAIHVKFNDVHITGSPFRFKVGNIADIPDPAQVHVTGNGLEVVKTGQQTDFTIITCTAGLGTLEVSIDGPSNVAMDCAEVEDGYKVRYTPLVPGDHYITVKYGNIHIVGSPFRVNSTGEKLADESDLERFTIIVDTTLRELQTESILNLTTRSWQRQY